ncbi:MAG TPA: DUF5719 family protein [Streptosporangiaceae bacterium]|nr:DUF5719 family protein [Streptosporangiaceae bacterium]
MTGRKVRPARSRLLANRLILAVLVLVVLAALFGVARISRPIALGSAAAAVSAPARLPVTSALVACPAPGSGGLTGGGLAVASSPATTGTGQALVTGLSAVGGTRSGNGVGKTLHILTQPGQLKIARIPAATPVPKKQAKISKMAGGLVPTTTGRGGVIIAAIGSMAQGFDAEQLTPAGLPTARCQAPGSDFWFVSPGAAKLHIQLYLLNPDSLPADAAVSVQTDSGPLLGSPDSGIVVPPHSMIVQTLDKLVHAATAVALHVTTSTGRVVAAVSETSSAAKPGIWLPVAEQPTTQQVLAGLPGSPGTRELYVTVPGNAAAQVKVTAVTPRGTYQPTGGNGISLLGHVTTGLAIPSLGGIPATIKISANVPVTAVLEVPGGPPGAPGAFISGSGPVQEQGVVAASPVGAGGSTLLVLSAPQHAASVRIAQALPGAQLTGQSGQVVQVPARSSVQVKIRLPRRSAKLTEVSIVVTPLAGSGPVYAARVALSGSTVQAILPVISSPTQILLPDVTQSLVAILR